MSARRAIALCQCFNGALEFQAGHWKEAEAALHESVKLYRELSAASGEALSWQRLGVLRTARGRLDDAMKAFEEGTNVAERAVMRAHCLTRLYASMTHNRLIADDVEAADQYLALGLAMGERHGNCATCDALLLPVAVSVRAAQGDFVAADIYCRQLEEAAARYSSSAWVAMACQSRGELAAVQGGLEEALECYSEAEAKFVSAGNQHEASRCGKAIVTLRRRLAPARDSKTRHLA